MPNQEKDRCLPNSVAVNLYTSAGIKPERFQEIEGLRKSLGRSVLSESSRRSMFRTPTPMAVSIAYGICGEINLFRRLIMETAQFLDVHPNRNPSDAILVVANNLQIPKPDLPEPPRNWVKEITEITTSGNDNEIVTI